MAQHKRLRASNYRKHLRAHPELRQRALNRSRRAHAAALRGESSNMWLHWLGVPCL